MTFITTRIVLCIGRHLLLAPSASRALLAMPCRADNAGHARQAKQWDQHNEISEWGRLVLCGGIMRGLAGACYVFLQGGTSPNELETATQLLTA